MQVCCLYNEQRGRQSRKARIAKGRNSITVTVQAKKRQRQKNIARSAGETIIFLLIRQLGIEGDTDNV
jgi:hypothetical protein